MKKQTKKILKEFLRLKVTEIGVTLLIIAGALALFYIIPEQLGKF